MSIYKNEISSVNIYTALFSDMEFELKKFKQQLANAKVCTCMHPFQCRVHM